MKVEYLHYVFETLSSGSIHKAANNLNITQQNLSAYIKSLERELGINIFNRSNKGVQLTNEGQVAIAFLKRILDEYLELQSFCNQDEAFKKLSPEKIKGDMSFVCFQAVARLFSPKIYDFFKNKYPNVNLLIAEQDSRNILQNLQNNIYDLALIQVEYDEYKKSVFPDNYIIMPLFLDSIVVLANRNASFANRKSIALSTLSQYPWVSFSIDTLENIWVYKTVLNRGVKASVFLQSNIESNFFHMIEHNNIALYSKYAFKNSDYKSKYNIDYIPIKEDIKFYHVLVINKNSINRKYIQEIVNYIQKNFYHIS